MPATPPPAAPVPESATTALYRAALGPVNTAQCLKVFERFDEAGRASPVWNPAAGFLTLNWMVFRQLWGAALVYAVGVGGLALLAIGLGRHFLQWPQGVEWGVLGALLLLSIAIPGAYGHAILHAHTRQRMTRAVREASTVREACATLTQQASTRRRLWVLVLVNVVMVVLMGVVLLTGWRGPVLPSHTLAKSTKAAAPAPAPVSATVLATTPTATPASEPVPVAAPEPTSRDAAEPTSAMPVAVAAESKPSTAVVTQREPEPKPSPRATKAISNDKPSELSKTAAVDGVQQAHGVNVGLFADRANAEKTHERLSDAGFAAILQTVERPSGPLTRVRVGPFASRAQADEAAARIRALGLDAAVFRP